MNDGAGGSIRHHEMTTGWARLVLDIRSLSLDGLAALWQICTNRWHAR